MQTTCSQCGKTILSSAKVCRFCKADLTKPFKPVKPSKYQPCPQCNAQGAQKVKWTPWGSFYFTGLLTHVRCPQCGYAYNGKTGRSNLLPAIAFLLVPLAAIFALIGWIVTILRDRGHLDF